MPSYDSLKSLQTDLIRKAGGGSLFLAPMTSSVINAEPFAYHAAVTGPPAVAAYVDLVALPTGYEDIGYLTDDGIAQDNEVTESNVTSWQSVTPTRSDITQDVDSITVVAQETKLLTIGMYTGADLSPTSRNSTTGTVSIPKPERPVARHYRGFGLAVDGEGDDEVFIGRIYPKLKVTGKNAQNWAKGDDPVTWGLTMTAFNDSAAGFSVRYVFGGTGWLNRLEAMGFTDV